MNVLETARKILLLEQREGFRDRAVVGGLDGFLEQVRLVAMPALEEADRRQLDEVIQPLEGYSRASQRDRREMLQRALQAMGEALVERRGAQAGAPNRIAPNGNGAKTPAGHDKDSATSPRPGVQRIKKASAAPSSPRTVAKSSRAANMADLDLPIEQVPGVNPSMAPRLKKLGIEHARDLLQHYPRKHMDRSSFKPINELRPGQDETAIGTIWEIRNERRRGGMTTTTAIVADSSGSITATWFNQPYLAKTLRQHAEVVLSGRVELFRGRPQLRAPDWELLTEDDLLHTGRIVPVYHLTEGLNPRGMRRLMKRAVDAFAPQMVDFLPEEIRRQANLMTLSEAIAQYHFPDSWAACKEGER